MAINGSFLSGGIPVGNGLADAYRLLDGQRIDIDRRLTELDQDDPERDVLWQELEALLAKLREAVVDIANHPAADLAELRSKAAILSALLRSGDAGGGPTVSEAEKSALALSITDDIARLAAA
jgi:hypothetical protein